MSRWTAALLLGTAVGISAGGGSARAGSLADALAAAFSPSPHSPASGKAQKNAEHPAKHQVRRHPHEGKPPVATPTVPDPQPVASPKAPPAGPANPGLVSTRVEVTTLKPHSVQTFAVLPPGAPPVAPAADSKEAPRPDFDGSHEPVPRQAAALLVEEAAAKASIVPAPAPLPAPVAPPSHGMIVFDLLLLLLVTCALASLNSRSRVRLPVLLRPARRDRLRSLLTKIDRHLGGMIGLADAESQGQAAPASSADAFVPHWNVTWDCGGVGPAGPMAAAPTEQSGRDRVYEPDRAGPELEDQLARIVQDQIVVPLRKAS